MSVEPVHHKIETRQRAAGSDVFSGFFCAFRGIHHALRTERHLRFHVLAVLAVASLGIYLELSAAEWGLVVFACGFVIGAELFNTALERAGDAVSGGRQDRLIGLMKDISAGAVLVSALTALAIGTIILFIPLVEKLL